jgi:hypothetical protein
MVKMSMPWPTTHPSVLTELSLVAALRPRRRLARTDRIATDSIGPRTGR